MRDTYKYKTKCPECGKEFIVTEFDQIPGFRDKEELICPYCHKVLRTSMEVEFYPEKV